MSDLATVSGEVASLEGQLKEYEKQLSDKSVLRFISRGILKTKIEGLKTQLDEKKAEQSQLDMEQGARVAHGNMLMESSKK